MRWGTFFYRSKLPIWKILVFCLYWIKNVTLDFICSEVDLAHQTGVDFASFCREVVYDEMFSMKERIGGIGKIVEIDESKAKFFFEYFVKYYSLGAENIGAVIVSKDNGFLVGWNEALGAFS